MLAFRKAIFFLLSMPSVGGKMLRTTATSHLHTKSKLKQQQRRLQECGEDSKTLEMDNINFFFELNDSDDDLGVQLLLGTPEPWTNMSIYDPEGILLGKFETQANFKLHGLSDFFFESAEPNFDEISRQEIEDRFPAGTYVFQGTAITGECLYGTAELTHNIPDGPVITEPVDNETIPSYEDLIISWTPSMMDDENITIDSFEVIVTNDEDSDYKLDVRYSSDTGSAVIPKSFLQPNTIYEIEVLTREISGNQAISIVFVTSTDKEFIEEIAVEVVVEAGEQIDCNDKKDDCDEMDEDDDYHGDD